MHARDPHMARGVYAGSIRSSIESSVGEDDVGLRCSTDVGERRALVEDPAGAARGIGPVHPGRGGYECVGHTDVDNDGFPRPIGADSVDRADEATISGRDVHRSNPEVTSRAHPPVIETDGAVGDGQGDFPVDASIG